MFIPKSSDVWSGKKIMKSKAKSQNCHDGPNMRKKPQNSETVEVKIRSAQQTDALFGS